MLDKILRESWAWKEIAEEGREEGREEERQRVLQRQRDLLLAFVRKRFPALLVLAFDRAGTVKEPEMFQQVLLKLFDAQTENEATEALFSLGEQPQQQ